MKLEIENNEEFMNKIKAFYNDLNWSEELRKKKEQLKKQEKKEKILHLENKFGFKYQKHTQVGQIVDKCTKECDLETGIKIFELITNNNSDILSIQNSFELSQILENKGTELKKFFPQKPNRLTVQDGFQRYFGCSLEYSENDTSEITLFKAAVKQDQELFEKTLNILDEKMKEQVLGLCALHAGRCRDISFLNFLIKNKVEINKCSIMQENGESIDFSPISIALHNEDFNEDYFDEELVRLFLDNGLDINSKKHGLTIYSDLMEFAPEKLLIELLDKVNDVNEKYFSGDNKLIESNLTLALNSKKEPMLELAKALVERGADVNFVNDFEYGVLDAVFNHAPKMLEYFLSKGANLSYLKNSDKHWAFNNFIQQQEIDFVEKLAQKNGLDVNYKMDRATIFSLFIAAGEEKTALELLDKVSDVNDPIMDYMNKPVDSYLTLAIKNHRLELIKALVIKGADVNFSSNNQNVWSHCANKDDIARIIVKYGKLELNEGDNIEYYNKIKIQVDFETKCEKDIEWLKSEAVFSFEFLKNEMLPFYIKNYKTKFANAVTNDQGLFIDICANNVKKVIKWKFMSNKNPIINVFSSSKKGDVKFKIDEDNVNTIVMPKFVFGSIGKFVFENICQEIEISGDSSVEIIN